MVRKGKRNMNFKGNGGKKNIYIYIAAGFLKGPDKLAAARHHVELCKLS